MHVLEPLRDVWLAVLLEDDDRSEGGAVSLVLWGRRRTVSRHRLDLYRRTRRLTRRTGKRVHRQRRAAREIACAYQLGRARAVSVFASLTFGNPFAMCAAAIAGAIGDEIRKRREA